MDEFFKSRFRVVGVMLIIITFFLVLSFLFLQYKEKKEVALRLKTFYSDMLQAIHFSKNLYGMPSEWGFVPKDRNTELLNSKLFNQFAIETDCIESSNSCSIKHNYKAMNKHDTSLLNLSSLPAVILKNGIMIAIQAISSCHNDGEICAFVFVDLNNFEEPNAIGRDLFVFAIKNTKYLSFVPYSNNLSTQVLLDDPEFGCNSNTLNPLYCTALIANKGWRIDSSYPW